jgi:hypothetical protein
LIFFSGFFSFFFLFSFFLSFHFLSFFHFSFFRFLLFFFFLHYFTCRYKYLFYTSVDSIFSYVQNICVLYNLLYLKLFSPLKDWNCLLTICYFSFTCL